MDPSWVWRSASAQALGRFGLNEVVVAALTEALDDPDKRVQLSTALAFGRFDLDATASSTRSFDAILMISQGLYDGRYLCIQPHSDVLRCLC